jgi:hypothetical protein
MNLNSQLEISAVGTSEGVKKAWDTRGRSIVQGECSGPDCKQSIDITKPTGEGGKPIVIPTIDGIELTMKSTQPGYNIHFDREALKSVLRMALVQMDMDDTKINYLNTPMGATTDHYVRVSLNRNSDEKGMTYSPGEQNVPFHASRDKAL